LNFSDKKAAFGIFGEALHTEVEPAFRVDGVVRVGSIMGT
jgi:hypothetical protein